ncbi:hypothetical protein GAYE_SCF23G4250 [Galdieria yellowstonensis]|uniref:Uncharacterized protein n=1 Tax=Galdieria yellowstonensis TaxID=3028027 RepID=A0AAV9IGI6_9RHOD|nr:hypothetical protein GAYE_SCF23G4250 [Galdieria yellowstonensis]
MGARWPPFLLVSHVTLLLLVVTTYLLLFHLFSSFSYKYVVKTPLLLGGIYLSLIIFQAAQKQGEQWPTTKASRRSSSVRRQQLEYREKLLVLKEKELEKKFSQLEQSLSEKLTLLKTRVGEDDFKSPGKNTTEIQPKVPPPSVPPKKMNAVKERKASKRKWFRKRFFQKKTEYANGEKMEKLTT